MILTRKWFRIYGSLIPAIFTLMVICKIAAVKCRMYWYLLISMTQLIFKHDNEYNMYDTILFIFFITWKFLSTLEELWRFIATPFTWRNDHHIDFRLKLSHKCILRIEYILTF